ncbi:MAG TPA: penicillin-binding protein 1C [Rhodocyclaceae bacterium]
MIRPLFLLCALPVATPLAHALPTFPEVKSAYVESEAWLLDRHGAPLQSLRIDPKVRRFGWTPLEAVSPALRQALVLSEDKRFYEHSGVDWSAVAVSAWRNLWNSRTRGASTLTMQLAGVLPEEKRHPGRRSVIEKLDQAATALRLEQSWRKDQILEAYLNLVDFRGELQGVAAMSRGLFGKWPDGLDERESAIAAVLLRSPNATPEAVSRRACQLLKEARRERLCEGLEGLTVAALKGGLREGEGTPALAPHLARHLLTQPGQRLRSSVDGELQRYASESLREQLRRLDKRNVEDGAVLVLDNASGEVLAWVGSSGDFSSAAEVNGVTALRQAGSTLKPFLYQLAIEQRMLTAASLVEDAPLAVGAGSGLYAPRDYESGYRGWVSLRQALGGSLNTPAVRTAMRVGADPFRDRLKLLGFDSLKESGEYYGFSLALGSADVSLLMLANAYRALANGGQWSPLRLTAARGKDALAPCREGGCEGVFDGATRRTGSLPAAAIVADILSDRAARVGTFGLESWLATPYWAAVKTGTSKDMRDNWCVGFSRRYTVAVWVGNASGEPMHDVSGISGAAPVWREVMDWLHRNGNGHGRVSSDPPPPPAGVVVRTVRFEPAREPPRKEWFLAGSERGVIRLAAGRALGRIAYPADGTVVALDPDIPPERQKLALELTAAAGPGWRWRMDGEASISTEQAAEKPALWRPRPGRHRLALLDGTGAELDAVAFEVRALRAGRGSREQKRKND